MSKAGKAGGGKKSSAPSSRHSGAKADMAKSILSGDLDGDELDYLTASAQKLRSDFPAFGVGRTMVRAPACPTRSSDLLDTGALDEDGNSDSHAGMTELLQNWSAEKVIRVIQQVEEGLNSNEASEQLSATKKVRQLLSIDRDPSGSQFHNFNDSLDREIVPQLLKFLKRGDDPQLQVEALWALCNAAAGSNEYTSMLLQNGAVPTLVKLLQSTNNEVLEQAVWVLGNIATDGSAARDAVLHAGAMVPLIRILLAGCTASKTKVSLMRIAAWTLSSLCDGQPHYSSFDVHKVLTAVSQVLVSSTDTEVLSHSCWALSHLCDGPSPHVQAVVEKDVCGRLVALLGHRSWRVVKPALRTVGNIVCAEDDMDYTQHVVDRNTVPCLRKLINHSNREIQKEACWTLSNIAAGTQPQIQCVLESGAVEPLVEIARSPTSDSDVKIEACWVLLNATSCGSNSQIQYLVEKGCVQVLCDLLGETTMVMMALEGIEKILQVGEDIAKKSKEKIANPYAAIVDSSELERLQSHQSKAIANRARRMWKQHYVTCAICKKNYSVCSPITKWCSECKSTVCGNCDCTKFHLSYQLALWGEEDTKTRSAKDKKAAANRKKKQKKKKKKKEKEEARQSAHSSPANSPKVSPKKSPSATEKLSVLDAGSKVSSKKASKGEKSSAPSPGSATSPVKDGNEASSTPAHLRNEEVTRRMMEKNDEFVDFLAQTGSILELAKMLEEDGEDAVEGIAVTVAAN